MAKKKDKHLLEHLNRRKFLALMGLGGTALSVDPISTLMNSMVKGIIKDAQACEQFEDPKYYGLFLTQGGTNRFMWDQFLHPYSTPTHPGNKGVVTSFKNGKAVYETIERHGANVPKIWETQIPIVGGGTIEMSELLQNMLVMRGIDLGVDNHTLNYIQTLRPSAGYPSVHGIMADSSSKPLASVAAGSQVLNDAFSSEGGSVTHLDYLRLYRDEEFTPLHAILDPFNRKPVSTDFSMERRDVIELMVKDAMSKLGEWVKSGKPGADHLYKNRTSAENLLYESFSDIANFYAVTKAKYLNLIYRSSDTNDIQIAGFTNQPIKTADLKPYDLCPGKNTGSYVKHEYLQSMIRPKSPGVLGFEIVNLAESCAVMEYLFTRGYSNSFVASVEGPSGLMMDDTDDVRHTIDEHDCGINYAGMLARAHYFTALSACMYELKSTFQQHTDVKTGANLWEEVVLSYNSEFTRNPRDYTGVEETAKGILAKENSISNCSGSDHSVRACVMNLYSGAFSELNIIGNTKTRKNSGVKVYWGDIGDGDLVELEGVPRNLTINHAISGVAKILGIKQPVPNAASPVSFDRCTNTLVSNIGKAQSSFEDISEDFDEDRYKA